MRLSDGLGMLVAQLARRAGAIPVIEQLRSTPWASATFSGARHRLTLRFAGDDAQAAATRVARDLDCAEFDLGRHILADIVVLESKDADQNTRVIIEALTFGGDGSRGRGA